MLILDFIMHSLYVSCQWCPVASGKFTFRALLVLYFESHTSPDYKPHKSSFESSSAKLSRTSPDFVRIVYKVHNNHITQCLRLVNCLLPVVLSVGWWQAAAAVCWQQQAGSNCLLAGGRQAAAVCWLVAIRTADLAYQSQALCSHKESLLSAAWRGEARTPGRPEIKTNR